MIVFENTLARVVHALYKDSCPSGVLPFSYETKRSMPGIILVVLLLVLFVAPSAVAKDIPPPNPFKYGAKVESMYKCNKKDRGWTEWEIRCVIRRQFGPAGQYDNAIAIARCETGDTWNPRVVSRTDDHGIFQINRRWNIEGWRLGANIYDPVWNTRIAYWFWLTRGWYDWTCARIVGVN